MRKYSQSAQILVFAQNSCCYWGFRNLGNESTGKRKQHDTPNRRTNKTMGRGAERKKGENTDRNLVDVTGVDALERKKDS